MREAHTRRRSERSKEGEADGPPPEGKREVGAALAGGLAAMRARTFDRKHDADGSSRSTGVRRKQLGQAAVPEDVPLSEFAKTYWRLHAVPNLGAVDARLLRAHLGPTTSCRVSGDYGVRELTPKRLARFREELERAGVETATWVKARGSCSPTISFAISGGVSRVQRGRRRCASRATNGSVNRASSCPQRSSRSARSSTSLRDRTLVIRTRLLGAATRRGHLPPCVGRRRRARDPLPRRRSVTACGSRRC